MLTPSSTSITGSIESKVSTLKQKTHEQYQLWNVHSSVDSSWFTMMMGFTLPDDYNTEPVAYHKEIPFRGMIQQLIFYIDDAYALFVDADGELGKADVICNADSGCEVYSWTFKELHDLMAVQPSIGMVFEKSIAADLNKKMVVTWLII